MDGTSFGVRSPSNGKSYYIPRMLLEKMDINEKKDIIVSAQNQISKSVTTLMKSYDAIQDNIRMVVFIKGVNEIAELANINPSDLSLWLNGKRKWSLKKLLEIARVIEKL